MNLQRGKTKKKEQKNKNKKDDEIIITIDGDDAWPLPDLSDAPRLKKNV